MRSLPQSPVSFEFDGATRHRLHAVAVSMLYERGACEALDQILYQTGFQRSVYVTREIGTRAKTNEKLFNVVKQTGFINTMKAIVMERSGDAESLMPCLLTDSEERQAVRTEEKHV